LAWRGSCGCTDIASKHFVRKPTQAVKAETEVEPIRVNIDPLD
jgi:hypothetical protein